MTLLSLVFKRMLKASDSLNDNYKISLEFLCLCNIPVQLTDYFKILNYA